MDTFSLPLSMQEEGGEGHPEKPSGLGSVQTVCRVCWIIWGHETLPGTVRWLLLICSINLRFFLS